MGRIDGSSGNSWLRWVDRPIVVRRVEGHQRAADRTAAKRPISVHIGCYPAMDGSGQEDGMGATATCLPLRSEARCRLIGTYRGEAAFSESATI